MKAGEWFSREQPVEINAGRRRARMLVRNTGDRPIQIGSHFHFFEVNRALDFDRLSALGMHLNVPAGASVRFEPGDEREVEVVQYGGTQRVEGFNGLVNGSVQAQWTVNEALRRARHLAFGGMARTDHAERRDGDRVTRRNTPARQQEEQHA